MTPLFDKKCIHRAWVDGQYLFSPDMEYIAFVKDGQAWSAGSGAWLGPVNKLAFCDRSGRPVLWNPGDRHVGGVAIGDTIHVNTSVLPRPPKPAVQPAPPKPHLPKISREGWSRETIFSWLLQ
jgi:hypothetical protein